MEIMEIMGHGSSGLLDCWRTYKKHSLDRHTKINAFNSFYRLVHGRQNKSFRTNSNKNPMPAASAGMPSPQTVHLDTNAHHAHPWLASVATRQWRGRERESKPPPPSLTAQANSALTWLWLGFVLSISLWLHYVMHCSKKGRGDNTLESLYGTVAAFVLHLV